MHAYLHDFFSLDFLIAWQIAETKTVFSSSQMSRRVFEVIRNEYLGDAFSDRKLSSFNLEMPSGGKRDEQLSQDGPGLDQENVDTSKTVPFELYKRQTTVVVRREIFLKVTCDALSQYKYVGPNQRADLILACRYSVVCYFS